MSSSHQSKERTTIEDNKEIIDTLIGERHSSQISRSGIISKLAVGVRKFWTEDSKNNSLFKEYKDQLAVPENFEYIKVPLLNDDILKNKNIHYFYKRNDKRYADMQQLLTQACTFVINIANNCLEAGTSNKIVESRALVTNAADAMIIIGKLNTMLMNETKTRLKPAFSESYQSL